MAAAEPRVRGNGHRARSAVLVWRALALWLGGASLSTGQEPPRDQGKVDRRVWRGPAGRHSRRNRSR